MDVTPAYKLEMLSPHSWALDSRNMNLSWPEKYTAVCSLHRAEGREGKEGDGRSKNAVLSHHSPIRLLREKRETQK